MNKHIIKTLSNLDITKVAGGETSADGSRDPTRIKFQAAPWDEKGKPPGFMDIGRDDQLPDPPPIPPLKINVTAPLQAGN